MPKGLGSGDLSEIVLQEGRSCRSSGQRNGLKSGTEEPHCFEVSRLS